MPEGTGLGLTISRQFVQLMGGHLRVKSQPHIGSTFIVELPVTVVDGADPEATEPKPQAVAIAPDQPAYRILIAEDNWANQVLLQNLLLDLGFQVQIAHNGQEAIDCWHTWQPHLIFMDIRMPGMNGYEATQYIREQEQSIHAASHGAEAGVAAHQPLHTPTKIIALTAGVLQDDTLQLTDVGCDALMRKPARESEIIQTLTRHLGVRFLYDSEVAMGNGSGQNGDRSTPSAPSLAQVHRLTSEDLRVLPYLWLTQFYGALTELSLERMLALIEDIAAEQPALARTLTQRVNNFDFERLLELTQDIIRGEPDLNANRDDP